MNETAGKLQTDCNSQGWRAFLELDFEHTGVRTVLKNSRHYGPLRVQRPFYPEDELAHVYILHPPGGVVGGDQLQVKLNVCNAAKVLCTTPGSGKFYLSNGPWAKLRQEFYIGAGSSLEWLPQENILFAGARLQGRTIVKLEDDAIFIGFDICCFGRPCSDEAFDYGAYDSRLEFYYNNQLILIENLRVNNAQGLTEIAGLRGHVVQANLIAFPCTVEHLACVRSKLAEQDLADLMAATLIDGLLIVRVLGNNSQTLKQHLISIWQHLRPILLERSATLPRIWAT